MAGSSLDCRCTGTKGKCLLYVVQQAADPAISPRRGVSPRPLAWSGALEYSNASMAKYSRKTCTRTRRNATYIGQSTKQNSPSEKKPTSSVSRSPPVRVGRTPLRREDVCPRHGGVHGGNLELSMHASRAQLGLTRLNSHADKLEAIQPERDQSWSRAVTSTHMLQAEEFRSTSQLQHVEADVLDS